MRFDDACGLIASCPPDCQSGEHACLYSLSDIRTRLFASVLSDCLDSAGVMDQALPARIRPLDEASVMVGRARTAQFMEVDHHEAGTNPYELEIALIDSLARDEIPVFACSNPARIAPWGELLSTAAQVRGAAGALMDGVHARHQGDPRDGLSGVPRRHRAARLQGARPRDGARRAGALRRRQGRAAAI